MKRRESSSYVWAHFTKSNQEASCNLCNKTLKFCGNTTNLREHLKRIHLLEDERPSTSKNTDQPETTTKDEVEPRTKKFKQCTLSTTIVTRQLSQNQRNNIDTALLQMICEDFQPLQIVENTGFLKFIKTLQKEITGVDTIYEPPSRKCLTQSILCKYYEKGCTRIKEILSSIEFLAITTDIWTSDSNKSYITVTCHCIYNDELQSLVLATRELLNPNTGENIAEILQEIFEDFGVQEKIVTIVSDNGANMKKAINQVLRKHHHPCIAHTLNLSVKEALNENHSLQNIIQKCRRIVGHFRHSAKSTAHLSKIQENMNMKLLKLKQDVETRWNSVSIMFARLCEVKAALTVTLSEINNAPENLDYNEWKVLADCVILLKNVEEITEQLSGEKYPTMALVIPLIRGLQYNLNLPNVETSIGTQLKETLHDVIQRRLGSLESNKHVGIACLLDPRFKKVGFGLDSNATSAQQRCLDELTFLRNKAEETSEPAIEEEVHQEQTRKQSIWDHFETKKSNLVTTASTENIITLRQYLELPLLDRKSNPLIYWKGMKTNNDNLYKLHLKYSCIPATSVPSERIFSKTGQVTNLRRNRLLPKHLDYIIFLNANWSLL